MLQDKTPKAAEGRVEDGKGSTRGAKLDISVPSNLLNNGSNLRVVA